MKMHMRNTLPGRLPILHRDVQRLGPIHALDHLGDFPHRERQVGRFGEGEAYVAGDDAVRDHKDVAWEEGLEVHEGVAELRARGVEDLGEGDAVGAEGGGGHAG